MGASLIRRERKDTAVALSRYLEQQALDSADPPMVLTSLQRAEFFTGSTRANQHRLAARCPLVVVFGRDIADDLGSGVHGVPIAHGDSLESQWVVLALGANTAAALVAREVPGQGDHGVEHDRKFDVAMTNDRTLVTTVARQLLSRMLTSASH